MFKVRVYSLCGIGTADNMCANAELWDFKPKLLCERGTTERQVAVYFLCGSGTTELPSISPCAIFHVRSGTAELKVSVYSWCGDGTTAPRNLRQRIFRVRKQNLKSQHIPYVEAELWNYKSQNILCAEAKLQVTDSRCGISLVPYALIRKTLERRAACPWVEAILVVLLFTGGGTYWDYFYCLRYYQAVTSKFSELMTSALYFF